MKIIIIIKALLVSVACAATINTGLITWGPKYVSDWVMKNSLLAGAINFAGLLLFMIVVISLWEWLEKRSKLKTSIK